MIRITIELSPEMHRYYATSIQQAQYGGTDWTIVPCGMWPKAYRDKPDYPPSWVPWDKPDQPNETPLT